VFTTVRLTSALATPSAFVVSSSTSSSQGGTAASSMNSRRAVSVSRSRRRAAYSSLSFPLNRSRTFVACVRIATSVLKASSASSISDGAARGIAPRRDGRKSLMEVRGRV
jgi:hypothetical protein